MLFLPSHCVTCVRKTRWRIIILCLLYNFNTKCRCIIISAFSSNSPINRRTNQNLPCWRFALWRYSSTRLSSVLLSGDIFAAENKRTTRPFFFGAHTSTDNQPATRWVRNNKGELQLSILYSTSISLKLYSSAYVVSQWILTSTLFTVLTVENDSFMSSLSYHIFDASTDCVCLQYSAADAAYRPRFWVKSAVTATFFRSKIIIASISFVLFDAPIADEHLLWNG